MFDHHETISTNFDDVDTSNIVEHLISGDQKPAPLTDLSRTENGAYILKSRMHLRKDGQAFQPATLM